MSLTLIHDENYSQQLRVDLIDGYAIINTYINQIEGTATMLSQRNLQLYNNLMVLCQKNDAFFFVDQEANGLLYRIFSYRLASYTDFLEPDALECRGHTFLMKNERKPLEMVSWPFEKFFNLNENPMTMNLDLSTVDFIHDKMDGSLISTVHSGNDFFLKSKQSLSSDQAVAALNLIHTNEFNNLMGMVNYCNSMKMTVIMEYVAPSNRIVVGYDRPQLVVLGVRDSLHGKYVDSNNLVQMADFYKVSDYLVGDHTHKVHDVKEFVQKIPYMEDDIEGYVIGVGGKRVKIKTIKYLAKHKTKDSVNHPRRLFEAVVNETSDDLRAMFFDDKLALTLINDMEKLVTTNYNHVVKTVEKFYNDNKELDKKSYAIKGQAELGKDNLFSLAMNLYLGKTNDYKAWMIKHYKMFGINDEVIIEE